VPKEAGRPRGRPRAYEPDTALDGATAAFWREGFAATSLDDLTASTAMNRPSLYAAFGDKRALYLKTLARYREGVRQGIVAALAPDRALSDGLRSVYQGALDFYRAGDASARGCYLSGTASTVAMSDADVRALLLDSLQGFDALFVARFRLAREHGEIDAGADPDALGKVASSMLHSLALRTRAGASRRALDKLADATIELLCRGAPKKRRSRGAR
jgi:AcrR family transcriptional regulator